MTAKEAAHFQFGLAICIVLLIVLLAIAVAQ